MYVNGGANLPVDGDVFIALVVDVDDDDIALARVDGRAGELTIHGEDGLLVAEPGVVSLLNLKNITRGRGIYVVNSFLACTYVYLSLSWFFQ